MGISDRSHASLLYVLSTSEDEQEWPKDVLKYIRHVADLSVMNGVVMHKGRVVIPAVLGRRVLELLHQAHQGTSGMNLRAQESVWWPGISKDITRMWECCMSCAWNAPTQPALPPVTPPVPEYPFQFISSDYFIYAGHTNLHC